MLDRRISQHTLSLSPELHLAVTAAHAAGEIIKNGNGQLGTIELKDVGDLVSQVDRDADRVIAEILESDSTLPILSEELNSQTEPSESMWIVDPLDASSAFLLQVNRSYPAVLIALRESNELKLGVAYIPLTNEWFYAQRGRGAWKDGKRLICDSTESLDSAWIEMNQYGNAHWETEYFRELRERLRSTHGARLVTSTAPHSTVAMRIATNQTPLAAAIHDNNPSNVKQAPWDIAAPQIIMEEAGGIFVGPHGHRTDPFRAEPIIVTRSQHLADQIRSLVAQDAGSVI